MRPQSARGQALTEAVLAIPLLLILVGGMYVACRTAYLFSSLESAVHVHCLRTGRGQAGLGKELCESVAAGENRATLAVGTRSGSGFPSRPFPVLEGNTTVEGSVRMAREEPGGFFRNPETTLVRTATAAVDCWGSGSSSGKKIRRTVQGIVAAGVLR